MWYQLNMGEVYCSQIRCLIVPQAYDDSDGTIVFTRKIDEAVGHYHNNSKTYRYAKRAYSINIDDGLTSAALPEKTFLGGDYHAKPMVAFRERYYPLISEEVRYWRQDGFIDGWRYKLNKEAIPPCSDEVKQLLNQILSGRIDGRQLTRVLISLGFKDGGAGLKAQESDRGGWQVLRSNDVIPLSTILRELLQSKEVRES